MQIKQVKLFTINKSRTRVIIKTYTSYQNAGAKAKQIKYTLNEHSGCQTPCE